MSSPTASPPVRRTGRAYFPVTLTDLTGGLIVCDCGALLIDTRELRAAHDRLHIRLDQLAARLEQVDHDLGAL